MISDPATYIPYINPARTLAREIRDDARYEALQALGICSDSFRNLEGLSDIEYCYFLRMNTFMPKQLPSDPLETT